MKYLPLLLVSLTLTAPALAMAPRPDPVLPSNQPVPGAELQALIMEIQPLAHCPAYQTNKDDFRAFDIAMSNAGLSATQMMNNYPRFKIERDKVHVEMARLSAKYGC